MKTFSIRIIETFSLVVAVEADSAEEAKATAKVRYYEAQKGYVLNGNFLEEIKIDFELVNSKNNLSI